MSAKSHETDAMTAVGCNLSGHFAAVKAIVHALLAIAAAIKERT